jgi:hypothetical protein
MSSKYRVRKISGIRELAQSLLRAIEKLETGPPVKPIPDYEHEDEKDYTEHITHTPPPDIEEEKDYNVKIYGSFTWVTDYEAYWACRNHHATKVIESGYFCPVCGEKCNGKQFYPVSGSWSCWRNTGRGISY